MQSMEHCFLVILKIKNEKVTLPHEFVFVFIGYFTGAVLSEKSCQKGGRVGKSIKNGDGHIGGDSR